MADSHVLEIVNGIAQVVMHFPVPTGNNAVGITLPAALVKSKGLDDKRAAIVPQSILPDGDGTGGTIDAVEKAAIADGTLSERLVRVEIEEGRDTEAKVQRALRKFYGREQTEFQAELSRELKWYGMTDSVV